jgi:beta-phosphoglucomutase-like phosphatase (HAD superfamily)
VLPLLERHGLIDRFEVVVCRDDVDHDRARTKPAPDLYELAVARLGLHPHEALALEDSPNGVVAACAAGLRCVAVPCGLTVGLAFPGAASELASLAECSLSSLGAFAGP